MSLRINQNLMAQAAALQLSKNTAGLESSISKLSSGLRINKAADDPTGLRLSENLRRQINGLSRSILNAQDGISLSQTAEGALGETSSILQRMRELALQASNGVLTSNDRLEMQKEVEELKSQIGSVAGSTRFNDRSLLNGKSAALISSSSEAFSPIARGLTNNGTYSLSVEGVTGGLSQMQSSGLFTSASGTAVTGNTRLEDISAMNYGNHSVIGPGERLELTGNGKTATVRVNEKMTLNDVAAAMQHAMVHDLGMTGSRASVVTEGDVARLEVTSGQVGKAGNLSIGGGQLMLDRLGFSETRSAAEAQYRVTAQDANGATTSLYTSSGMASGLLSGVDVAFSAQGAQIAGNGGVQAGVELDAAGEKFTLGIGADTQNVSLTGSYTMEGLARSINAQIEDGASDLAGMGLAAQVEGGQLRLSYRPTDPASDGQFSISGVTGGVLGLQEGSYEGFAHSDIVAESRVQGVSTYNGTAGLEIKVKVGGKESTLYTTKNDNTGDLKELSELTKDVNTALGGVAKFEVVNNALTFSSYDVGKNASLTLTVEGGAPVEAELSDKYGLTAQSARGQGEATATVKVTDAALHLQLGPDIGQAMRLGIGDMSVEALGLDKLNLTDQKSAELSLKQIDRAMDMVSSERSKLGAFQNSLEHSVNSLTSERLNTISAESRIRDVDMASEIVKLTSQQLLANVGASMMGTANTFPNNVLKLLGGDLGQKL
jgi:flagellin